MYFPEKESTQRKTETKRGKKHKERYRDREIPTEGSREVSRQRGFQLNEFLKLLFLTSKFRCKAATAPK